MQYDPKDAAERTGSASEAGAQRGAEGAGQNHLEADLGDTAGDRSASAFSDTSGTLGRESLGGGESAAQRTAEGAKERMAQVKEKASTLRATLADKLESGAERLRQRAASASAPEAAPQAEERMRRVGGKMASGMESTAHWLRTGDMSSLKSGIEEQLRTKPGRTLLVALGLGYLIGRVIRGGRREG
jgi:hypothetical protein